MLNDKKQTEYLDKIDELLSSRESKKESLKRVNTMLQQGFALVKQMLFRWYVLNEGQTDFEIVVNYLEEKHGSTLCVPVGCGVGELHGKIAFIPHDCRYSWEITQEEFNYLKKKIDENN